LAKETYVSVATLSSLEEILSQLTSKHLGGNQLSVAPVCTRVMLRTGVNIRSPKPEQQRDRAVIVKVLDTLAEMGYPI
jgi:hypothetical protein